MSLEQQISKGIMEAMKAKEPVRLQTLRNIKKYIIEAKTAGTEIAELPDADVLKIISKLAKQGTDSAAIFSEQNRPDLASEELAQVAVFQEFLPRQLTPEELTAEVKALIAEVGAADSTATAETAVVKIIAKLAKQGSDSAEIYRQQNRADLAEEELAQVAVMQEFLPRQLSPEELTEAVRAVIAEVGATSVKEMGKVMGVASKRLAGQADGKDISAKVRELLG